MEIAVLSDIHNNSSALTEVAKVLKRRSITDLFILGDFVGYYFSPLKVFDVLSNFNIIGAVKGNHELMLEQLLYDDIVASSIRKKYGSGLEVTLSQLSKDQINWLINLPINKIFNINGKKILLCHGSPKNPNEYFYPDSTPKKLQPFMENEADIIFYGHTHYPCIFKLKNKLICNPGSIGQSRKIGGIAQWAIFHSNSFKIEQMNTPYNTTKLEHQISQMSNQPKYLHEILNRTKEKNEE